jgi:hypothetical protein
VGSGGESVSTPTGPRRTGVMTVAALTVAAVAVGVAAISSPGSGDGDDAAVMTSTSQPSGEPGDASVLRVDHGPSNDLDAVAACAGTGFAADLGDVEVVYDVVQDAPGSTTPVLFLRNADGDQRVCDMTEPDSPAAFPVPQADADDPVVELTTGDRIWDCDHGVLAGFQATTWLSVHAEVAEVAQRFVVDGTPGPWFTTSPVDGIAHLQVWLGPQVERSRITMEQRALDADGTLLAGPSWPASQRIAGCRASDGDVQIG